MKYSILFSLLLFSLFAKAEGIKVNGIWYDFDDTNLTATVSYSRYDYQGSVIIPETVTYSNKSYTVTSIDRFAFGYNSEMTSLSIPKTVTFIVGQAFRACNSLVNITVDSQNPKYDTRDNCNGIIETASNTLVVGCRESSIPSSVKRIGDYAYYGYETLSSIVIPNGVESIGAQAFFDCNSLTSINLPASVISIDREAFWDCSSLSSITVETGNPIYDSRNGCNAIIKTASNTLVVGCKSTEIPNGIQAIGNYAFAGCHDLVSLEVPNSVNSLGTNAFYGCWNLVSITSKNPTPPACAKSVFGEVNKSIPIYVPEESVDSYKSAEGWKDFNNIVALEGETPETPDNPDAPQCAKPTIAYNNGKLQFSCDTKDVKYVYSITPKASSGESTSGTINFGTTFNVSVYATREGYKNSETATAIIDMSTVGDMNGDGLISIADVTALVNLILGRN